MGQRILVLDDEENYADMLRTLLEQHSFLVDSVTDPLRALESLHSTGYDLVISDFKMPAMDGADFLSKARELNPDLPIILVSGLMNTPELVKVANMGVTLVLEKPIDIQQFIQQVKQFVQPVGKEEFRRHRQGESGGGRATFEVKTDYPEPRHVAGRSTVSKFFLQKLWGALQEQDHIFVTSPPGSEADWLLREASLWRDGTARELRWLDLRHVDPDAMTARLAAMPREPGVSLLVGVAGFAGSSLASQEHAVDVIRESPEELGFMYFIDSSLLEEATPRVNPELLELLEQSHCVMPPLSTRLADLVYYAQRCLARLAEGYGLPGRGSLDLGAGALLLAHAWPGNVAELVDVLRVAVQLGSEGPVTGAEVAEALRRVSAASPGAARLLTLEEALLTRQNAMVASALSSSPGQGLTATLGAMGVDAQSLPEVASPEALPLLCPELLTQP